MVPRRVLTVEEIWRKYDRTEARLTRSLSERMVDLAGLRPGMSVLDLATGRGEPAILAAHRVAPGGYVLGVDRSATMLEMAQETASLEGASNVELRALNAESLDGLPTAHFHATLVRWAFGLTPLLNDLPEEMQLAWENDLVRAAEPLRADGLIRLGRVTRIVVASAR